MTGHADITVVLIARNAAETIEAAIGSVRADTSAPILLVDDFSDDATAVRARLAGGEQIKIVRPERHIGTGLARHTALDHIATPFGLWLDSDDMQRAGRTTRVLERLAAGADLVYESCVLVDAETGTRQTLSIPDFIAAPNGLRRQYERNWLPALFGGFRTDFARAVGYDAAFEAAEDYDFLLRALGADAQIALCDLAGVDHFDRPGTVSRRADVTRSYTNRARRKHLTGAARMRMEQALAGYDLAWLVVAQLALGAGDYALGQAALSAPLSESQRTQTIPPYNRSASDIQSFLAASALYGLGDYQAAAAALSRSTAEGAHADTQNNLGVLRRLNGEHSAADTAFEAALALQPHYLDARLNRDDRSSQRWTWSPLRVGTGRDIYR